MTNEDYADKINKLLAKAESTNSDAEAEALVEKAQEWMTKYAIDEALLARARGTEAAQKIIEEDVKFKGNMAHAYARICDAIARQNDCRTLWTKAEYRSDEPGSMHKYNRTIHVIGFEGDVERVKMLNASLQIQAVGAMGRWWKEVRAGLSFLSRSAQDRERRTFLEGFGTGLQAKLEGARRSAVAEATATSGKSVALVIRGKGERIGDWIDEKYGKLSSVRNRQYRGSHAAGHAGTTAGLKADVGGGARVGGIVRGELGR